MICSILLFLNVAFFIDGYFEIKQQRLGPFREPRTWLFVVVISSSFAGGIYLW